jgi:hypothetical protein
MLTLVIGLAVKASAHTFRMPDGLFFIDEDLEVVTTGGNFFNVNSTAGTYWSGDGGAYAGLSAPSNTTGFVYIGTTGGGTPTGTPAGIGFRSGATPIVYDPTGDTLWVWNTGSHTWKAH